MTGSVEAISAALHEAELAVDQAAVAQDLRPAAFTAAFGLIVASGASQVTVPNTGGDASAGVTLVAADSPLAKIAATYGLDLGALSYVYEEDGDDLRLVIRRDMLPNPRSRAAAMRDVAALVMTGRQVAGLAEWTPYEKIRRECEELGVLDRANFATEVQRLDVRLQGDRNAREARLTRHGLDQAGSLLRRMLEGLRSSQASD